MPCALCVNGAVRVTNTTVVDARTSFGSACGAKYGVYGSGDVKLNHSTVYGGDGGTTANQSNKSGIDFVEDQSGFAGFALTDDQLAALRAVAQDQGRYYQGSVTFDAGHPLPATGVVFVDTVDRAPVGATTPDPSLGSVTLGAGARPGGSPFHGWLVVNGDLTLASGFNGFAGVAYAVNHLSSSSLSATDVITGILVAAERRDDADAGFVGNDLTLVYDCATVQEAGPRPRGWFIVPGTYRELPG